LLWDVANAPGYRRNLLAYTSLVDDNSRQYRHSDSLGFAKSADRNALIRGLNSRPEKTVYIITTKCLPDASEPTNQVAVSMATVINVRTITNTNARWRHLRNCETVWSVPGCGKLVRLDDATKPDSTRRRGSSGRFIA
jgi:hypothetical protein